MLRFALVGSLASANLLGSRSAKIAPEPPARNYCQQLCDRDGPKICKSGVSLSNGRCVGYFVGENGQYCYWTFYNEFGCDSSRPLTVEGARYLVESHADSVQDFAGRAFIQPF